MRFCRPSSPCTPTFSDLMPVDQSHPTPTRARSGPVPLRMDLASKHPPGGSELVKRGATPPTFLRTLRPPSVLSSPAASGNARPSAGWHGQRPRSAGACYDPNSRRQRFPRSPARQLEPDLVRSEPMARQPRPVRGLPKTAPAARGKAIRPADRLTPGDSPALPLEIARSPQKILPQFSGTCFTRPAQALVKGEDEMGGVSHSCSRKMKTQGMYLLFI